MEHRSRRSAAENQPKVEHLKSKKTTSRQQIKSQAQEKTHGEAQNLHSKINAIVEGLGVASKDSQKRLSVQIKDNGKEKEKGEGNEPKDGSAESRAPGGYDYGNIADSLWRGGGARRVPDGLKRAGSGGGGGNGRGNGSDNGAGGNDGTNGNGNDGGNDNNGDGGGEENNSVREVGSVRMSSELSDPDAATIQYQQLMNDEARIVDRAAALYGEQDVAYGAAMAQSADAWEKAGIFGEAERLRLQVLVVLHTALGPEHVDIIKARAELAAVKCKQGKFSDAEKLQIQVLDSRKITLGPKHPDTIHAMIALANTLSRLGGLDKQAEDMLTKVLTLRRETLGSSHADTIKAVANLAGVKFKREKWDNAEKLQLEVLEWRRATLGFDHPTTIQALAGLVSVKIKQEKFSEAEKLQLQIIKARKSTLGPNHPTTLKAMANLASTWRKLSLGEQAQELEDQIEELSGTRGISVPEAARYGREAPVG